MSARVPRLAARLVKAGWPMLAAPWIAPPTVAQEIYGGLDPAPAAAAAATSPHRGAAAEHLPTARTWRDRLTPFQDPAGTEPDQLKRPLEVPLPPDLLEHVGTTLQRPGHPISPQGWSCATRASALQPGDTRWALEALQEDQPPSAAPASPAAPAAPPLLTLPKAIHLALCHNPQVRASWSAIAQQAAQIGQARSAYWPQLNAGIARQHSRVSYGASDLPANTVWATSQNAQLSWRLLDFGARGARVDAARAQLASAVASQDATVQKALADILQAYGDVQTAQARLQTQQALLPMAERSVQAARHRQSGGAGSGNDTLQAITAQARIQLELSRSEGDLDKAKSQLAYLLGLPAGTRYRLQAMEPRWAQTQARQQDAPYRLLARSLDDWLERTRQTHPAIRAAHAQWEAARASLKLAQTEGLPTLDLNLAHYRNGRPNTAISDLRSHENVIGLSLSIPLFDGFATTYKVRAAQAVVEQKAIELQATEQQVLQETVQLHAEARAALKNLQMAGSLYAVAGEAASSTQRLFDRGAADVLQLNQGLNGLQQAQLELARAMAEWNRVRLRLELLDALQGLRTDWP